MKNPPHPGKVVRVSCLEPLGLNITEGAKVLGVSRQALSHVGRNGCAACKGIRLYDGDLDTRLQASYDVAQARACEDEIEVKRYERQPV